MRLFDIEVKVMKLSPCATLPTYSREGDAGIDLYTAKDIVIMPYETVAIPIDIAVAIPFGHEGTIRPRSGNSLNGVKGCKYVPNDYTWDVSECRECKPYLRVQLGTIDSNYRGNLGIITYNQEAYAVFVPKGTKLAQLVISPVDYCMLTEVNNLDETNRGENGFGSSGHR
jgi:dUTP pyrophosphatase